jgi:hypothetical protein
MIGISGAISISRVGFKRLCRDQQGRGCRYFRWRILGWLVICLRWSQVGEQTRTVPCFFACEGTASCGTPFCIGRHSEPHGVAPLAPHPQCPKGRHMNSSPRPLSAARSTTICKRCLLPLRQSPWTTKAAHRPVIEGQERLLSMTTIEGVDGLGRRTWLHMQLRRIDISHRDCCD